MPPRLFPNYTSIIICVNTFINSLVVFCALFFLPVYFQACKLFGPQHTGVALLPQSLVAIPGAAFAAAAISRWGRYKPIHVAGFAIFTLSNGLLTMLNPDSGTARWVIFQCVTALGAGMMLNSQLPAFQSFVEEKDQAATTAAWGFICSIAFVWGVAIPGTVLNSRIDQVVHKVSDLNAKALLSAGGAYGAADAAQIKQFSLPVQGEIRLVYTSGIELIFYVMIGFTGLAFLLSLLEREIKLREMLETEFGLEHKNDRYKRAAETAQAGRDPEPDDLEEKSKEPLR